MPNLASRRPKTAERGYGGRWQRERLAYLQQHPLCIMCKAEGRVAAATVVDHIKPHKGVYELLWDQTNWQSLCKQHHDRDKQAIDRGGKARPSIGADGWPLG